MQIFSDLRETDLANGMGNDVFQNQRRKFRHRPRRIIMDHFLITLLVYEAICERMSNNKLKIAKGRPNYALRWQVPGIRRWNS